MPYTYTINTQGGEPRTGGPYPNRAELHKAIEGELLQGGREVRAGGVEWRQHDGPLTPTTPGRIPGVITLDGERGKRAATVQCAVCHTTVKGPMVIAMGLVSCAAAPGHYDHTEYRRCPYCRSRNLAPEGATA